MVCPPSLLPLFAHLSGIDDLRTPGDIPLEAFDAHLPLMSLPYVAQTTLETICHRPLSTGRSEPLPPTAVWRSPPYRHRLGR